MAASPLANTVSPRLNNREPFRPSTRSMAKDRIPSTTITSPDSVASTSSSPTILPAASSPLPSEFASAHSSRTATPTWSSIPPSPAHIRPSTGPSTSALSSSPIKLSAPSISRPEASQAHAAPTQTSLPRPSPGPSRPASPVKFKAKVTEGISSARKHNKPPASPPKPNVVKSTKSVQGSSFDHGLGISLPTPTHDDDGDTSAGDTSFVYQDHDVDSPTAISQTDAVMVHLRLRPLPATEPSAWVACPPTGSVSLQPSLGANRSSGGGTHIFDAVHTGSSNDDLYKTLARPLVRSVLSGFNALIFAYGQTASGKTFTLSGDDKSKAEGITQKAVKDLFKGIRSSNREREWLVRCSWVEVYNEGVNDLLEPGNVPQIRSSAAKGTFVAPLAEIIVTSPSAIFQLLDKGQKNRHVNATDWNERSSRSHTAFRIIVESWARGAHTETSSSDAKKGKKVRVSELVLVDLAGSEKYVTQGGKERRAEGANINKSLLTLGKVIFALSEKGPAGGNASASTSTAHIPYRDSKLTRILQNSLSGNSKIAVVATLNQTLGAVDESLSTINFAKRIKKVQLSAKLNEIDAPESSGEAQALLVKYRSEADALRRLVLELQSRETERKDVRMGDTDASQALGNAANAVMEDRIEELEQRLQEIGQLVVRGEGQGSEGEDSDSWEVSDGDERELLKTPTPMTPRGRPKSPKTPNTPSHLNFSMPSSVLRQELHTAHLRITSLQSKLSSRRSLSPTSSIPKEESEKDALIVQLRKQLCEAEIALEASSLQPLPKIREDVEAEYTPRIAELEKDLREARTLNEEVMRECERLERVNRRLIQLAHRETSELVGKLKEESGSPHKAGYLGAPEGEKTPTMRRLKAGTDRQRPKSVLGDFGLGNHSGNLSTSSTPLGKQPFLRGQRSVFELGFKRGADGGSGSGSGGSPAAPTSALRRSHRNKTGMTRGTGSSSRNRRRSSSYDLSLSAVNRNANNDGSDAENQGADESALVELY